MQSDDEELPRKNERLDEGETKILQDLQANLLKGDLNKQIEERLFETQKEYFAKYLEKAMNDIPMGEEIMKIIKEKGGEEFKQFEYVFTATKCVLQSHVRIQQITAIRAVFDMVYSLMSRYVHENVITPALKNTLSPEQLKMAFEKYKMSAKTEEMSAEMKIQSMVYCIDEVIKKRETVKVPNPYYSQATQHIKAMCDYIVALLIAVAKPHEAKPSQEDEREEVEKPEDEFVLLRDVKNDNSK